MSPKPPRQARLAPIKRGFRHGLLGLSILFLAVHLMGLGHSLIPVHGTLNMILRPDGTELRREWVPIERISPHLIYAVIAAEDSRFCQHIGIDFDALNVALEDNKSGGRRRGGSTLTQQIAKNVFLWNGGGYARKAVEAWFALYIDTVWSKRRIMEVYLNVAEWGDGIFGAQAAAHARFGKPASDLTPREAALLAAVLPSPNKWRVNPPGSYVQGRASTLQQRARVVSQERLASCVIK
ncbi:monofunctional biosynthetic peptidoglycan transglycosylase [Algimonas arctica]|uniref:Biosynthetic peptidoglycan transglycosylase n=1 Tax=Algimonas arctica TaxID=1479486 RepID=A0A8J3CQQ7_9PROT|nr:monofunctional biosynthetic peptidoglycan transglycosylase [Algimonas arctica]GHA88302.1 monofunctional biosynthetic peptidoglycan transglycosylase [Algimonas arctica]